MQTNEQENIGQNSQERPEHIRVAKATSGGGVPSGANNDANEDRPENDKNANAADDQPWVEPETQTSSNNEDR